MPFFDRTGPLGRGPMTGRGFGPCGGFGRRGFLGFGRRTVTKTDLQEYKESLVEELKEVEKQLNTAVEK